MATPVATAGRIKAPYRRGNQAVAPLILVLLGACNSMMQRSPEHPLAQSVEASAVIVVARRGWHVDIGFVAADLAVPLASLGAVFPNTRYLMFGFGDRRYLLAGDRKGPAMLAALWPGPGLILVTGLAASPEEAFGNAQVIRFAVTPQQAKAAEAFIWRSLAAANGGITPYADGPYEGSVYFGAVPAYSAWHTCNTWAAQVLKAAGIPVRSAGVVFAGQLWSQAEQLRPRH